MLPPVAREAHTLPYTRHADLEFETELVAWAERLFADLTARCVRPSGYVIVLTTFPAATAGRAGVQALQVSRGAGHSPPHVDESAKAWLCGKPLVERLVGHANAVSVLYV